MKLAGIYRAGSMAEPTDTERARTLDGSERILGASIVGAEAGELIHVFVALIQAKAPARAIVDAESVHPTFAEGLQSVLMQLERFSA